MDATVEAIRKRMQSRRRCLHVDHASADLAAFYLCRVCADPDQTERDVEALLKEIDRLSSQPSPWKHPPNGNLRGVTWEEACRTEADRTRELAYEIDRLKAGVVKTPHLTDLDGEPMILGE